MKLYHYTCQHGRDAIGTAGTVQPLAMWAPQAAQRLAEPLRWMTELAWFTDLAQPDREGLGLTMLTSPCDRTAYRYQAVELAGVVRWLDVWRDYRPHAVLLHLADGVRPGAWWVAREPVPVALDQDYMRRN
jgi:hypothetical protein